MVALPIRKSSEQVGLADKLHVGSEVNHMFSIKRMIMEKPKERVVYEVKGC